MIDVGIIQHVEDSKWIIPIVIHDKKKIGEFRICIDLRKLNDPCLHDPFPTPFTDEVLESVGGQEMYSFTDGFSSYHQVRIAKENLHKMTFVTEWGCYQYTVMPFGLKNALAIFSRIVVVSFKDFIQKFIKVYFNDWIVFGLTKNHIKSLRMMLECCR